MRSQQNTLFSVLQVSSVLDLDFVIQLIQLDVSLVTITQGSCLYVMYQLLMGTLFHIKREIYVDVVLSLREIVTKHKDTKHIYFKKEKK